MEELSKLVGTGAEFIFFSRSLGKCQEYIRHSVNSC